MRPSAILIKNPHHLNREETMILRAYESSDCPSIAELFYNTVHTVNAKDYSSEQLDAWAAGQVDLSVWDASFLAHRTIVAVEDGRIIGFGDMDGTGYLDRLYVHKDCQGRGIASGICDVLEQTSPSLHLTTHASITARPFFDRRGWRIVREQQVERRGVLLTNFVMERYLADTPTLETERLILRTFTEDDREALFSIYSDNAANRFLPWFPVRTYDEADALWRTQYADVYQRRSAYKYAVCLKNSASPRSSAPVGYVHLDLGDAFDLGYGLRTEFWHQGIASEAAAALIRQARQDGIPYVTATHDRDNPRSGQVMNRLGMRYQYSYEELWQPKNLQVIFRMYQLNFDGNQDRVYKGYWDTAKVRFVEAIR